MRVCEYRVTITYRVPTFWSNSVGVRWKLWRGTK